jgi:hypothetical protein
MAMTKFASFLRPRLAARQKQTGDHPDTNLLLAFAEGQLSDRERNSMLAHLAECPVCREVLSLSSGTAAGEISKPVSSKASPAWWAWRLAAPAAVICLVAITVSRLPLFKEPANPILATKSMPPALPAMKPEPSAATPVPAPPPSPVPKSAQPGIAKYKALPLHRQTSPQPEPFTVVRPPSSPLGAASASRELLAPRADFQAEELAAPSQDSLQRQISVTSQTRWALDSPSTGVVKKSQNGGRTWSAISVDPAARLYALSANDTDVWVGGSAGKLFHSADGGLTWTPVPVADADTSLSASITGIDARGPNVTLKTDSRARWTSDDGGIHWHRRFL